MKQRQLAAVALACLVLTPFAVRGQGTMEEALRHARAGSPSEALAAVDVALAARPDDARAHFTRGVILAEEGRTEEAAEVFRRLIESHPELPEAYNNLAVIQAAGGDFDGAVKTLKKALATSSSYQTTYENLTRIFAQLASEAYSRALQVDSAPAREEVELVMLADVGAVPGTIGAPMAATEPETVVAEKMAPAEPMLAVPDEPMAAAPTVANPAPMVKKAEAASPTAVADEVESEDLAAEELEPSGSSATSTTSDLAGVVDAWARAWSEQRVDDYLAFYGSDFAPANGMGRREWESNRRQRIGTPEFIKVDVAILDSAADGADRASVTFLQAYESDTFSDQVTKTLTLVREDAGWKIVEEKSGS